MKRSSSKVLPTRVERPGLRRYLLAFLAMFTISGYAQAQVQVDLALCLDGSGSISGTNFATQRDATHDALASLLPIDGSVRLTVLQFSTVVQIVVSPTPIISQGVKDTVLGQIAAMTQLDNYTNTQGCIAVAQAALETPGAENAKKIIDVSTDGEPTVNAAGGTCLFSSIPNSCSNDALAASAAAYAAGINALNVVAVGDGLPLWYMDNLVFPTDLDNTQGPNTGGTAGVGDTYFVGCPCSETANYDSRLVDPTAAPPGTPEDQDGFIIPISTFDAYQTAIEEKLILELSGTFTVFKEWYNQYGVPVPAPFEVEILLECTGVDTLVDEAPNANTKTTTGGMATFDVSGYGPDDMCMAQEIGPPPLGGPPPSWIEVDRGTCGDESANIQGVGECTITNTIYEETFTVTKEWVGLGDMTAPEVEIQLSCADGPGNPVLIDGEPSPVSKWTTGGMAAFNITQFLPPGYCMATEIGAPSPGVTMDDSDCQDEDFVYDPAGAPAGACTITNTIWPTVTLHKTVTNDNGGLLGAGAFPVTLKDAAVTWGVATQVDPDPDPPVPLVAEETSQFGYVPSGWTCDLPGADPVGLTQVYVPMPAPGQNVNCYITNDDIAPTVTLVKHIVDDDGGIATPADFQVDLTTVGTDVGWGTHPVTANVPLTVTETIEEGWNPQGWTCRDWPSTPAAPPFDMNEAVIDALLPGMNVTCDLTNDDMAPTLRIVKHIVHDDQTVAAIDAFGIRVDGSLVIFDPVGVPGAPNTTDYTIMTPLTTLMSNTPYNLTELNLDGYAEGQWSCTNGDAGPFDDAFVTLDEGEDVTCEITNERENFDLTLTKVMVQPGFPDTFIMDADGTLGVEAGDGATSSARVFYGDSAYIDELPGAATDLSYWNASYDCTYYPEGPAPFGDGSGSYFDFTMPASNVDCTITNNRVRVHLILQKEAIGFDDEFCYDFVDVFGNFKPEFFCTETSHGYGLILENDFWVGHYQFNEIIDGQFVLESAICDNGQNPEEGFDLVPGVPLTCTWVNILPIAIPVNNPWALLLMVLMVLGVGWYYRPATMRQ